MVAIHNRALTPTQIQQNFDAGVGEKYFMLFNVSHLVPNVPQAYIMTWQMGWPPSLPWPAERGGARCDPDPTGRDGVSALTAKISRLNDRDRQLVESLVDQMLEPE